jgi:hypothetical protein
MENLLKGAASLPQTGAGLQPSCIALSVVVHLRLEQINYSDKASRAAPVETGDIRCREPAQVEGGAIAVKKALVVSFSPARVQESVLGR